MVGMMGGMGGGMMGGMGGDSGIMGGPQGPMSGSGGGALGGLGLDLAPYKMPIIGGFFQNPDELHQKQGMHEMALAYGAMRPETQQAQENALRQTSLTYQPYQNLMAMGYGDSAATPTDQLMSNPMSYRAMGLGSPRGTRGEGPAIPGSLESTPVDRGPKRSLEEATGKPSMRVSVGRAAGLEGPPMRKK